MSERKRFSTSLIAYMPTMGRRLREAALFVLLVTAIYFLLSLISYDANDPGWSNQGTHSIIQNTGGKVGSWIADFLFYFLGYMAFLFPILLIWIAVKIYRGEILTDETDISELVLRLIGFLLTLGTGAGLFQMHTETSQQNLPSGGGGIIGDLIAQGFEQSLGFTGGTLFQLALFLAGITLFSGLSWLQIMDLTGRWTLDAVSWIFDSIYNLKDKQAGKQARMEREEVRRLIEEKTKEREPVKIEPFITELEESKRAVEEIQQPLFDDIPVGELPPLSLLEQPPVKKIVNSSPEMLEILSRQVEIKLADFNIEVQVVAVHPGPVITRFELQPAAGVKGSQIGNLSKDLARGLSVISVRVVDVIPGKSVIGLEIPNAHREIVYLSEILRSKAYDDAHSPLTLALGKDIGGQTRVTDLVKMPHMLVAGTTGSGKSVAINAMILSLLYKSTPKEVRLILVDPKMLELAVYEDIPHLLTPVVTDMKDAANALRWCVGEMERRYKLMAELGVRNLAGFNKKVADALEKGEPIPDPLFQDGVLDASSLLEAPPLETLPSIVIIIDEFADLMMIVGKKTEELIARLAQKARAAGIHLILATQRPSVDVITGLIKANIPSRVAFQVASKIDSRTILDQMGAEQLLGHGDMLFMDRNTMPDRVHGAFVSDEDVHQVVSYIKKHSEPDYNDDVMNELQPIPGGQTIGASGLPEDEGGEQDPLYDQAVAIVTQSRRASISYVQRRLSVGYNRAARLIEEMENAGIVSRPENNGSREVLAPAPPED